MTVSTSCCSQTSSRCSKSAQEDRDSRVFRASRGQGWRYRLGFRVDAALRRSHQVQDSPCAHQGPKPHHGRLDLVSRDFGGDIGDNERSRELAALGADNYCRCSLQILHGCNWSPRHRRLRFMVS